MTGERSTGPAAAGRGARARRWLPSAVAAGVGAAFACAAGPALASEGAGGLDGASLGLAWALPFVGMLFSIAICPLLVPSFWHHHFGKVAVFWALAFLIPFGFAHGWALAGREFAHVAAFDYLPFVILLGTLFTIAGGILVTGNLHGTPSVNAAMLVIGTLLASLIGTTGASMVMIRPLIRANDGRRHNIHVIVFFIFLVSNIGGSLTPLGDPPLFLGYLRGVEFFWTAMHLVEETVFAAVLLIGLFYAIDRRFYRHDLDFRAKFDPTPDSGRVGIAGKRNIALMMVVVMAVLVSGSWQSGVTLRLGSLAIELQNLLRDVVLLVAAGVSLAVTPRAVRIRNGFEWGPILEVAKLFAGIFVTIIPVIAMLKAAGDGAFAPVVELVSRPDGSPVNGMYFWATGLLSSFLDNAPTYLVFFNLAGGDPGHLMGPFAGTLAAISCGAVYMGANSYIGNAPNFMVKSIAEGAGLKMPSFFGYMLWSAGILLPLFALVTFVFFL